MKRRKFSDMTDKQKHIFLKGRPISVRLIADGYVAYCGDLKLSSVRARAATALDEAELYIASLVV